MVKTSVKVAVTGGSGFVGRHVLASLKRRGVPYVVIGRSFPSGLEHDCFKQVDLIHDNLTQVIADLGCTHLIHLAWYAEHGLYWTSAVNVEWVAASLSLIKAFCAQGKHVTAIGTCAEYDWSAGVSSEGCLSSRPATLYGRAKLATAQLVMELCLSENIPCCWARLFYPFGQGESRKRLIPSVADALLGRSSPISVGGKNWRDFMAVEDVADALVHLSITEFHGDINVCSGEPRQICSLVDEICGYLRGNRDAVLDAGLSQNNPRWIIGDNSKLMEVGWRPALSFSERLISYVEMIGKSSV